MSQSTSLTASTGDTQSFTDFTDMVQKERELLDQKKRLEDEVKWLDQTLSFLTLAPSASNLPAQAVVKVYETRR